jgi:hypothetical protein
MIRVSKIADPHRLDDVARPGNDLLDGVGLGSVVSEATAVRGGRAHKHFSVSNNKF